MITIFFKRLFKLNFVFLCVFLCYFGTHQQTFAFDDPVTANSRFYNPNGFMPYSIFPYWEGAVAVQSDGKVIVGGNRVGVDNNFNISSLVRYNLDGTRDITFNPPINLINARSIIIQPDGKILVAGLYGLVRLMPNGQLDTSFTPVNTSFGGGNIYLADNGNIYLSGRFGTVNGISRLFIVRILPNGQIDNTFSAQGIMQGVWGSLNGIFERADGKIVIGGLFQYSAANSQIGTGTYMVMRLNNDGSRDTTFTIPSIGGTHASVFNVYPMPGNQILVVGKFGDSSPRPQFMMILDEGGLRNPTATNNLRRNINSNTYEAIQQDDGKIVVIGGFTSVSGLNYRGIARFTAEGILDTTFRQSSWYTHNTNVQATTLAKGPNDTIVIAGSFATLSGNHTPRVIVKSKDGETLSSFSLLNNNFNAPNREVATSLKEPGGSILIGGPFNYVGNIESRGIARILVDGSIDRNFIQNGGFWNGGFDTPERTVNTIARQNDGKILVGGLFGFFNDTQRRNIARLNPNGTLDTTFNPGAGFNGQVRSIAIQPDGKILAAGDFTAYSGVTVGRYVRLEADGRLDTGFSTRGGANHNIYVIFHQSNGQILIGGEFSNVNGTPVSRFARLNSDGSIDTSFQGSTAFGRQPRSILEHPDGKLVVGGSNRLQRLNANGSLDTSRSTPFNNSVRALAFDDQYNVLVGGNIRVLSGTTQTSLTLGHVLYSGGRWNANFTGMASGMTFNGGLGNISTITFLDKGSIFIGGNFTHGPNNIPQLFMSNLYIPRDDLLNYIAPDDSFRFKYPNTFTYSDIQNRGTLVTSFRRVAEGPRVFRTSTMLSVTQGNATDTVESLYTRTTSQMRRIFRGTLRTKTEDIRLANGVTVKLITYNGRIGGLAKEYAVAVLRDKSRVYAVTASANRAHSKELQDFMDVVLRTWRFKNPL